MREIKFRVYNKTQCFAMSDSFTIEDLLGVDVPLLSGSRMTDELEWLQYTGLKDKNGVEIYEGNIVECWLSAGEGEDSTWIKGAVNYDDGTHPRVGDYGAWFCSDFKVIGNIYENPELLKEGGNE